jgi:hypothetical protein
VNANTLASGLERDDRRLLKYSRDGVVCIWNINGRLHRTIDTKELSGSKAWVSDAVSLSDQGKLALLCDDRKYVLQATDTV